MHDGYVVTELGHVAHGTAAVRAHVTTRLPWSTLHEADYRWGSWGLVQSQAPARSSNWCQTTCSLFLFLLTVTDHTQPRSCFAGMIRLALSTDPCTLLVLWVSGIRLTHGTTLSPTTDLAGGFLR